MTKLDFDYIEQLIRSNGFYCSSYIDNLGCFTNGHFRRFTITQSIEEMEDVQTDFKICISQKFNGYISEAQAVAESKLIFNDTIIKVLNHRLPHILRNTVNNYLTPESTSRKMKL